MAAMRQVGQRGQSRSTWTRTCSGLPICTYRSSSIRRWGPSEPAAQIRANSVGPGQPPGPPPPPPPPPHGRGRGWGPEGDSHDNQQPDGPLQAWWLLICNCGAQNPIWVLLQRTVASIIRLQRWIVLGSFLSWSLGVQPAAAASARTWPPLHLSPERPAATSNELHALSAAQDDPGLSIEQDLLEEGQQDGSPAPPPRGGAIQALKRLLREVFADLIALKQQVEDLTPKSEDEDEVIPHDGGSVGPVTKGLAPGVRFKSKSQLSGSITWGAPLTSALMGSRTGPSAASALWAHTRGTPMELLLQTMTQDRKHTLTARLTTAGIATAAAEPGMGPSLTHLASWSPSPAVAPAPCPAPSAHDGGAPAPAAVLPPAGPTSAGGLTLQGLLYRAELLGGALRVCLAPVGGSLSNMARRINPKIGSAGLTSVAQQGHGVPAVLEPGAGAVLTWLPSSRDARDARHPVSREGVFSASLGHFISSAGNPWPSSTGAPSLSSGVLHHTVGQVALHSHEAGCVSLVVSSASVRGRQVDDGVRVPVSARDGSAASIAPGTPTRESSMGGPQPAAHWQSTAYQQHGASGSRQDSLLHPAYRQDDNRVVRLGIAGFRTIADALSVAAWHSRTVGANSQQCMVSSDEGGAGQAGAPAQRLVDALSGSSYGCQLSSVPDSNGVTLALTLAAVRHDQGEASHLGPNAGALVSRDQGAAGCRHRSLLAELSAHVPVSDGVWVNPGVVVVSSGFNAAAPVSVCVACSSGWQF